MTYTLDEQLDNIKHKIESELEKYLLPLQDTDFRRVNEAMAYSTLGGGKRLRAILLLQTAFELGTDYSYAMPFACALEMIHAYSLIHDDLPSMDNDTVRRGKASCHVKYDEATAVLAGDALLTYAFEICAGARSDKVSSETVVKIISLFANAAGSRGMVGGQMMDIQYEGIKLSDSQLYQMDLMKTGALFTASVDGGCILAGVDADTSKHLHEYARNLGLAFQITDDILDYKENNLVEDKSDFKYDPSYKNTFVSHFGFNKAKELAAKYTGEAVSALDINGKSFEFHRNLAEYLLSRAF